jgi:hypothetical protein
MVGFYLLVIRGNERGMDKEKKWKNVEAPTCKPITAGQGCIYHKRRAFRLFQ